MTAAPTPTIHATCIALSGAGVVLRGESGAGKSDLALRLLAEGWRLVADDRVALARAGDEVIARAPAALAGLIEARGAGILAVPPLAEAAVELVVDLVAQGAVERMPDPPVAELLGVAVPRIALAPFEASATIKLRLALDAILADKRRRATPSVAMNAPLPPPSSAATPAAASAVAAARPRVLVVTGMSGAGRSTALKALEDLGYEAVDNLPANLLGALVQPGAALERPLAIGIDVRTRDFGAAPFLAMLDDLLRRDDIAASLVFLDCADDVLQRRFSQTRRRHPLAADLPIADAIFTERRRVSALRERANPVIDTTDLSEPDLKRVLRENFGREQAPGMAITVISFAFGQGLPRAADLVFDVRFLRNPHYAEALRAKTGRDGEVGAFIEADADFARFFERLTALLDTLLPRYRAEGKSYLTVALGCTGGKHRSVYVAEKLAEWLKRRGERAGIRHRELGLDYVLD